MPSIVSPDVKQVPNFAGSVSQWSWNYDKLCSILAIFRPPNTCFGALVKKLEQTSDHVQKWLPIDARRRRRLRRFLDNIVLLTHSILTPPAIWNSEQNNYKSSPLLHSTGFGSTVPLASIMLLTHIYKQFHSICSLNLNTFRRITWCESKREWDKKTAIQSSADPNLICCFTVYWAIELQMPRWEIFLRSQINQMSKCQTKKKNDESTMASTETTEILYLADAWCNWVPMNE